MSEDRPPTQQAVRECAEWLGVCLGLGWRKSDLDWLEALWWKYHDRTGRLTETERAALDGPPADTPPADRGRTVCDLYGHHESCGRWVDGPDSFRLLDHEQACTCGGVELDPEGAALDGPR